MKAIITTVAIFILSSVSCNCEVPRQIMLGFPLEQYELFDRVQECRDEGFTFDESTGNWVPGIADANYPKTYRFNDQGFLLSIRIGSSTTNEYPFIQSFTKEGLPIERGYVSAVSSIEDFAGFEQFQVADHTWYVNHGVEHSDWYAWSKQKSLDGFQVLCIRRRKFNQNDFLEALVEALEDETKKYRFDYVFDYRIDGTVRRIQMPNNDEMYFDENGNLSNHILADFVANSYSFEIESLNEAIQKYIYFGDEWVVSKITYLRDDRGNWVQKDTHTTLGDWTERTRITRKISYFE